MAIHDWTRVDAGLFHDFHLSWIAALRNRLNKGVLPEGYYALSEQSTGAPIGNVVTLTNSKPMTGGLRVLDHPIPSKPSTKPFQTAPGTHAKPAALLFGMSVGSWSPSLKSCRPETRAGGLRCDSL